MLRYPTTLMLSVWNVLCLGLVAVGFAYGFLGPIFHEDVSKLSSLCALLLLATIAQTTYKAVQIDAYSGEIERLINYGPLTGRLREDATNIADFMKTKVFLYLGLLGTVIGLTMVIYAMNIKGTDISAIKTMMDQMKAAMRTAFYATGVGITCKLWVEVITFILGNAAQRVMNDVYDLRQHLAGQRG